jgi:sugar phosphate isomerase/epimerase
MRLGLSSYTYTWAVGVPGREQPDSPMRAEDLIDRAAALDVPVVQIADNLPLDSGTRNLDRLTEHARACGVDIEVGTRGIARDHLRRYLAVAVAVGSPLLRVVVDTADHHPTPAEVVDTLAVLRPEFEAARVVLAIENHDRFTAAELARVVTSLGTEWTGVCLDTVNSFGALEGPAVVVGTLAGLAVNLHVKDFVVVRAPHSMGFTIEGRPAGAGRLDVPELLAAIGRYRNDITAVLELWTPPQETLEATLTTERTWAEDSVAYLKTLIPSFDRQPVE